MNWEQYVLVGWLVLSSAINMYYVDRKRETYGFGVGLWATLFNIFLIWVALHA